MKDCEVTVNADNSPITVLSFWYLCTEGCNFSSSAAFHFALNTISFTILLFWANQTPPEDGVGVY